MKSPNNGGGRERVLIGYFLSPNEASSTWTGLYLIELFGKVTSWEYSNNQCCFHIYTFLFTKKIARPHW